MLFVIRVFFPCQTIVEYMSVAERVFSVFIEFLLFLHVRGLPTISVCSYRVEHVRMKPFFRADLSRLRVRRQQLFRLSGLEMYTPGADEAFREFVRQRHAVFALTAASLLAVILSLGALLAIQVLLPPV